MYTINYQKISQSNTPKITVITVVFNNVGFIEATIRSVIEQSYDNVEYIVIDGGSIDGTLDIVESYEKNIDYWLTEEDKGIYDAMNKGIDMSSGDWVIFMNSGDVFIDDQAINNAVKEFNHNSEYKIFAYAIKYDTGKIVNPRRNIMLLLHNTIPHQGVFYHNSLFAGFRYDNELRIISDYELNLRCYVNKVKIFISRRVIALCAEGGLSRTNYYKFIEETNLVRSKVMGNFSSYILGQVFKMKVYISKIIRHD